MEKFNFSIMIKAPKDKVWDVLWNDTTYRIWTSPFSEGSYAESNWQEGGKILFLLPNGSGMSSIIVKKTPNEFMSFKHLTEVKNFVEQPIDEKIKQWSGAMENYTLKESGGSTELTVEIDGIEEHVNFFKEAFPRALKKVKELSEK